MLNLDKEIVRVGVIGLGQHSCENLIPALRLAKNGKIVAVSSRDQKKADRVSMALGLSESVGNWQQLVDSKLVDAIVVSATPSVHRQVAKTCLERGINVFVEKPPAENTDALQSLISAEEAVGTPTTFVNFNFRYGTTYQKLREIAKRSGGPRVLKVRMIARKPSKTLWDCTSIVTSLLYGLGIHAIDLAVRELGRVNNLTAFATYWDEWRVDVCLFLGFEEGRTAMIELGNYSNRFEYRLECLCAGGTVLTLEQHDRLVIVPGSGMSHQVLIDDNEVVQFVWPSLRGGFDKTGYRPALDSFLEACGNGTPSSSSFSDCAEVYRVIDEALRQMAVAPGC